MNLVLLLSAIANVMVMTIMGVDDDYYDDDVDVEMTMTIRIEMGYDHYYSPTLERVRTSDQSFRCFHLSKVYMYM